MELYSQRAEYKLYHGNMLDMCEVIESGTIDSIVTDPPYGLTTIVKRFGKENSAPCKEGKDGRFARLGRGFMGKERDGSGIEYNIDAWRKCYEVLKPGGYLLAFGGSRTYHRIACAIEDAGFEIRDCIMWLYGSGFPKSLNIGLAIDKKNGIEVKNNYRPNYKNSVYGKAMGGGITIETQKAQNKWDGWGTALKPSYEPIIVARKPCEGSCTDNVIKYGVGGINIDECRVGTDEVITNHSRSKKAEENNMYQWGKEQEEGQVLGRFPANTILTYDESDFEEVCGGFHNDEQRYYYTAKASKRDRDEGLQEFETKSHAEINNRKEGSAGAERAYGGGTNPYLSVSFPRKNIHPTVKPTNLMQYLIRLVTPKGGIVLDPFNGSGSTGKAVMHENKDRNKGYKYIGIELTDEYLPISKARIEYVINGGATTEMVEMKHDGIIKQWDQESLFINK